MNCEQSSEDYDLVYLSMGGGVQSSVMALMLSRGLLDGPRPDVALFADTGWEPRAVYEHLDRLEPHLTFPLHRIQKDGGRTLKEDAFEGLLKADLPYRITKANGKKTIRGRHCTANYKVLVIHQWIRAHLQVRTLRGKRIGALMGISFDEALRMKTARDKWEHKRYPLCEATLTRRDCLKWWAQHGLNYPLVRSACISCPFRTPEEWVSILLDDEYAEELIVFDEALRSSKKLRLPDGWDAYLHRSHRPLAEVVRGLKEKAATEQSLFEEESRPSWINECEGHCGV